MAAFKKTVFVAIKISLFIYIILKILYERLFYDNTEET